MFQNVKEIPFVRYNKLLGITLFVFIISEASFFHVNILSGTFRLFLVIFNSFLIYLSTRKSSISGKSTFIFIFVCLLCVFSAFLFISLKQTIIISVCIVGGYVFYLRIPVNYFIESYKKVLFFLTVWSLSTFGLSFVFPKLITLFPYIQTKEALPVFNLFFSVVSDNTYVARNYGLFWEPGAFSIFLNIGMFFELFASKMVNRRHIFIYIITILTTMSTLGVGCMILLIVAFVFNGNNIAFRNKLGIVLLFVIGIFVIFIYGEYFIFHVFGKLSDENNVSTTTRLASIIYMWEAFIQHPILGIGFNNFLQIQADKCFNMATCTPLNWLAIYGVGGLLFVVGLCRFFIRFSLYWMTKCCLLLFSLLLFSTENFIQIPFIYYLIFSGYNRY